jgi:hypothetical protein
MARDTSYRREEYGIFPDPAALAAWEREQEGMAALRALDLALGTPLLIADAVFVLAREVLALRPRRSPEGANGAESV